ncbi:cellulose biosynthesis protein BcsP [Paraburkholderia humisilvae]|uniref:Cellulose biosynthesis protein BcsR n=1 Tax=Paraburkholderia humisilvae TaxID=627669 RepID=A0A6J5DEY0_9BURK|nr:cellulose biosynthesis protein BcsP [Paraburkholderia humisilvae]CAB3751974.1 hypothetical protein LMG29542_01625 [Paraburkholderia humisilvae]
MSVSDDIGNLFQRFGGDPDRYQEVSRDDDVKYAASRWPLLTALDIAHPAPVPGAGQPLSRPSAVQAKSAQAKSSTQPLAGAPAANAPTAGAVAANRATLDASRGPFFARGHLFATTPPPVEPARAASARFSTARDARAAASGTEAASGSVRAGTVPASMTSAPQGGPSPAAPITDVPATAAPIRDESRQLQPGILTGRKQTFAQAPGPGAVPAAQPQPAPRAAATDSILSGMFAIAAREPSAQPAPRELASVFARLAGVPGADRKKTGGGQP